MTKILEAASNTPFEAFDGIYDPLADADHEEDFDGSDGQPGPCVDAMPRPSFVGRSPDLPADQRISQLFASLATRRRVLMGILAFLDEPRRADALQRKVDELQEHDVSVYSGHDYSLLLEEAGAVRKTDEDGGEFDEEAEQAPDVVEVDGVRFYKPTDGRQVFWTLTGEGRAYLESDDPLGRLADLLEEEPRHRVAFGRMLAFCRGERGRSVEELAALVDGLDLPDGVRRHCSYFARRLELCDALAWNGGWRTTASGERGLESLFPDRAADANGEEDGA
ncbi:hypothetical protein B5F40_11100 [Gordonibacter sp. An230]|uniref:hypothetical protein n=1 Tax=Gordonibacter sp. An230 TaxID=1965592 RepID=UPI000B3986B2|nr:hypothetical protein [Gordonibacter sp. An230]OUO89425.1 hypothetical protein B5F40_11100 [Gordonibacter sp. An230]